MKRKPKVHSSATLRTAWRRSRGGLLVLIVFTAFVNLLRLSVPLYILQVMDRVIASRSVETLIMLTALTVAAVAAGSALDIVRRRMLVRWSSWVEATLSPELMFRSLSEGISSRSASSNALYDISRIQSFISRSLVSWLDVLWAPIFFIGIFLVHPLLGWVAVIGMLIIIAFGIMKEIVSRAPRHASRVVGREASGVVAASERQRESVGALSMAATLTNRWQQTVAERSSERERVAGRAILFTRLMSSTGRVTRVAVIGVGVWLILLNVQTFGGVFAARIMTGIGLRLVTRAVGSWRGLVEAIDAYRRTRDRLLIDHNFEASSHPDLATRPLVIDSISFRHSGQRTDVFRRLTFELGTGELLVVSGAAATGKTTLCRLVAGVLAPKYGQVRLGDTRIDRLPNNLRGSLVGYVTQETELFEGTVRENISRLEECEFVDVVAAAQLAEIHEMILQLPDGYDTPLDLHTIALSGSQRKRIALARAFFRSPRLIVMDEPYANLDGTSRRAVEKAIKSMKEQGTTFIVTQSIKSIPLMKLADKFLTLGAASPVLTKASESADSGSKKLNRGRIRSIN
jgi:ATP-binding cassette, subfamily C, bacterial exporter for protease/lipase